MASKSVKSLQRTFVTGVLLLAPLAVTTLIVYSIVGWVADHSPFGFWGGIGFAVGLIFLVGWISRTALGSLLSMVDDVLTKVPGLGVIYGYIHDMVQGLGGNDKRFRQPVWIYPYPGSKMRLIGFITREDLNILGLKDDVAVFIPLSYNISGTLVVLPRSQVKPLKTKSKDLLAFVASGGLAGAHAPKPGEIEEA
ncbi:MAG TPA: DUF502 domain-containing protein [bacterium]|jgi:uncharacterized membrane protein|nr:DUF502 domain-containing protein [bacterium]